MKYLVEYQSQNWAASDIEASSPLTAARLYLQRDSEKKWEDYAEIIVCWGPLGKQRESFTIQSLLPSTAPECSVGAPTTQAVSVPGATVPPLISEPTSKLKQAWHISLAALGLSTVFLFIAFTAPQVFLGAEPTAPTGTESGSVVDFYHQLGSHNYRTNVQVMQDIAQNAILATGITSLVFMYAMKRDGKAKRNSDGSPPSCCQPERQSQETRSAMAATPPAIKESYCPRCGRRVVAMSSGNCPSCLQPIADA